MKSDVAATKYFDMDISCDLCLSPVGWISQAPM